MCIFNFKVYHNYQDRRIPLACGGLRGRDNGESLQRDEKSELKSLKGQNSKQGYPNLRLSYSVFIRYACRAEAQRPRTANSVNVTLLPNQHLLRGREIACFKRIEIDSACDRLALLVFAIPIGGAILVLIHTRRQLP